MKREKILKIISVGLVLMATLTGCCLKHEWEAATCTAPQTCIKCEKTEGEALGHTWVEATCEDAKTCSVCKETDGQANGHSWINATCTTAKVCSVCEKTEGDALGHDITAWTTEEEATCTRAGVKTATCSRCKEKFEEFIPMAKHEAGEWVVSKAATLDNDGERIKTCVNCAKVVEEESFELSAAEKEQAFKNQCYAYKYNDIARYPEKHKGAKAKFTGEVIQVMESSLGSFKMYTLRVDVTRTRWGYDDTVYVTYSTFDEGRILEDDVITMYGTLDGMKTYETVMGASITIPKFEAEYIEFK